MQEAKALGDIADNLEDDFSSSVQSLITQQVIADDKIRNTKQGEWTMRTNESNRGTMSCFEQEGG